MQATVAPPSPRTLSSHTSYIEAERAVDQLADEGFPVDRLAIVGEDLRYIESVTGRATYASAAGRGALAGAGTGVFFGFIFGLFNWITPLISATLLALAGLLLGSAVGAIFGLLGHALTGKHRGFNSVARTSAQRFDVVIDENLASRPAPSTSGVKTSKGSV